MGITVKSLINVYSSPLVKNELSSISCEESKKEVANIDEDFAQQEVVNTLSDKAVDQMNASSKSKKEVNESDTCNNNIISVPNQSKIGTDKQESNLVTNRPIIEN